MNIKSSLGRSLARLASTSSIRARALAAAGAVIGLSAYTGIVATPVVEAANVPCDAASLVNALAPISAAGHSGTLSLAPGCTYTMTAVNNTFDGPNAFPDILGSVTIIGNGATITRSGAMEFRFFVVDDGGSMNISNVTLSNGSIPTGELHGGGAILNRDHLTANGITVSGNHSMGSTGGGGIDNHDKGVLSVTNSTFSGNVGLQGGGIEDEATLCHTSTPVCGSASVSNSTFTGNSTTMFGGGGFEGQLDSNSAPICPPPASLGVVECQEPGGAHDTLTGDTFTGNSSITEGGGIAIFGTATVTNSTITGNTTGSGGGGGIQNTGTLTVVASTISGNSTTSPTGADLHSFTDVTHQPGTTGVSMSIMGSGTGANCGGTNPMTNNGYNIDSGTSCGFSNANHSQSSTDPLLNSLASNGGPTQTMSLQNGSPAIGAGPGPCAVSTDQRGAPRANPCDVGAFEVYTTRPTTPSGLAANANGGHEIDLSWSASSSPLGIAGYDIFRDGSGTALATVSGATLTYADTGLTDATAHSYTVDAFDGNLTSLQSSPASATTADVTPPTTPGNFKATLSTNTVQVNLSWNASTDNVGVAGYTIYRNGTMLTTVGPSTLTYTDSSVAGGTTYTYTVDAFDAAGNHSAQTSGAQVTTQGGQIFNSLGGILTSAPSAASTGVNQTFVFVRGTDNGLWYRVWNGSSWGNWISLGGILTSDPSAVSWGPNRVDVFVRGTDNGLWQRTWNGTSWGNWQSLGGILTSSPGASSWAVNRLDVFVRGTDNGLWQRSFNGTSWGNWQSLGGILTSNPSAVSSTTNQIDVFVRGTDNGLWQRSFNGTSWSSWKSLGGILISSPAAASCTAAHLDLYVIGTDHAMWHIGFDGSTWGTWQRLGGYWTSDPGAVCPPGTSFPLAFGRGTDNGLWQTSTPGS